MNIINKRGGDKVLSVYWFVILIMVAGGIFAMVSSFYNHPYDVRELEAKIMVNKIADCLSNQGELNSNLFDEQGFSKSFDENFYSQCHLNLDVEDIGDEPQYFIEIKFYNSSDLESSLFEISKGEGALIAGCEIQKKEEYEREVKCVEEEFFSFRGDDLYLIKILSIVKKTEKNVK